jgi:hypothetical protein
LEIESSPKPISSELAKIANRNVDENSSCKPILTANWRSPRGQLRRRSWSTPARLQSRRKIRSNMAFSIHPRLRQYFRLGRSIIEFLFAPAVGFLRDRTTLEATP